MHKPSILNQNFLEVINFSTVSSIQWIDRSSPKIEGRVLASLSPRGQRELCEWAKELELTMSEWVSGKFEFSVTH